MFSALEAVILGLAVAVMLKYFKRSWSRYSQPWCIRLTAQRPFSTMPGVEKETVSGGEHGFSQVTDTDVDLVISQHGGSV